MDGNVLPDTQGNKAATPQLLEITAAPFSIAQSNNSSMVLSSIVPEVWMGIRAQPGAAPHNALVFSSATANPAQAVRDFPGSPAVGGPPPGIPQVEGATTFPRPLKSRWLRSIKSSTTATMMERSPGNIPGPYACVDVRATIQLAGPIVLQIPLMLKQGIGRLIIVQAGDCHVGLAILHLAVRSAGIPASGIGAGISR